MSQDSELRKLEGFVGKLLENFRELKEENGRLNNELKSRGETIAELEAKLSASDEHHAEISSRVNGLIDQIEEWEIELGEEVVSEVPINDPSRQGSLFSTVDTENENSQSEESPQSENSYNQYS